MSRLDQAPDTELAPCGNTPKDLELLAFSLCARYSRVPDVNPPSEAKTLHWDHDHFVYVFGWDKCQRRLLEVFRKTRDTSLESVLAFQYPPPLRKLFPQDYDLLYSDDPWGNAQSPPRFENGSDLFSHVGGISLRGNRPFAAD